jgi:hypothetical protein
MVKNSWRVSRAGSDAVWEGFKPAPNTFKELLSMIY